MADPKLPTPTPKVVPSLVTGPTNKTGGLSTGGARVVPSLVTGPTATGLKSAPGAAPKKKKTQDPWAPVLSFGQSVIDTLSTPLYGVEGTINALLKGKNPIEAAQAGADNATAWTRGKRPITGAELLKTAGIESNFWSSLAADVLLDPLTYTPGVVFTAPLKAAGVAGKAAIKAGSLAAKGEIAAKAGTEGAKLATGFTAGFLNKKKPYQSWVGAAPAAKVSKASESTKAFLAKYAKKQEATKENLAKYNYTTIPVSGSRTTTQVANDVLASAFTAGKQALVGTILSTGAKNTLRKYAKTEARLLNKPGVKQIKPKQPKTPKDTAGQLAYEGVVQGGKVEENLAADIAAKATGEQLDVPVIPDTAPTFLDVKKLADAAPSGAEKTRIQTILNKLNKESAAAKVSTFAPTNSVKEIKTILSANVSHVKYVGSLKGDLVNRLKEAITRKDGATPFSFYQRFADSTAPEIATLASRIGNLKVDAPNGARYTIAEIAKQYPNGNAPLELVKQAAASAERFLRLGTVDGLAAYRYAEISKLFGTEIADKFKASGILDPSKTIDQKTFDKLISELPEDGSITTKGYGGYDDLIIGLQRGDVVDTESLLKVIRALDPEGNLEAQVEKAMGKDPFAAMRDLLLNNVRSVTAMRTRLDKLDPELAFKSSNVGFADTANIYWAGRSDDSIPPLPEAARKQRQAAAEAITDIKQLGPVGAEIYRDAINAVSRATHFTQEEIEANAINIAQTSASGVEVLRTTAGKMSADSKAVRQLEATENFMTKIYNSIFGTATYKASKSDTFERQAQRLQDFARKANMSEMLLLGIYGVRPTVRKQAAKLTKKGEKQHIVYLHLGDLATISLKDKKFASVLDEALHPRTPSKYDGVSTTGLAEAMRMVLESLEKKTPLTKEKLAEAIRSKGPGQKAWSEEFTASMPRIADELATYLSREDVAAELRQYHELRMLADIEDGKPLTISMTQELANLIQSAYKAANNAGTTGVETTVDTVRQYFNEFVYKSHILDQAYGPAGETMLKAAAAMFIKDGKVGNIPLIPEGDEAFALFREGLANYYKFTDATNVAPAGRELFKYPTPKQQADLQVELSRAQDALDKSREARAALTTKEEVKKWAISHAKLQKKLDAIRPKAWAAWLQTYHWNGEKWIESEYFNPTIAAEIEKKNQVFITVDGPVTIGKIADETNIPNPAPKQTKAQKAAASKKREEAADKRGQELAQGAQVDAAAHTLDKMDEFEAMFPDDEIAQIERSEQERLNYPIKEADIKVQYVRQTYDAPKQLAPGEKPLTQRQMMAERASATYGKQDVAHIASTMETRMLNAMKSVQDFAVKIFKDFKGAFTEEEYIKGFQHALSGTMPVTDNPLFTNYVQKLTTLVGSLKKELGSTTIKLEAIQSALRFYKIGQNVGINPSMTFDEFKNILNNLPISEMPSTLKGTDAEGIWNDRLNAFKTSGTDPLQLLLNLSGAIQMAKTQTAIGRQFAEEFGQRVTAQKARELGLVEMKAIPGATFDLTVGVPKGVYFDPYFVDQFAAMSRGWSDIYEKGMPDFVRIVLDLTGMLKATQTVLMPRHHVVTFTGDMIMAMLAGVRNPVDFYRAMRITFKHAGEDITANFRKSGAEKALKEIMERRLGAVGGRKYVPGEEDSPLILNIGGKQFPLDNESLRILADDNGFLTNPTSHDQVTGAYEAAVGTPFDVAAAEGKELRKNYMAKYKQHVGKVAGTFQQAIRPASAFVSYAGNIPRMAHAIHIMKSRKWASVDEMIGAVTNGLNKYHPTIQSLSGWERKYPRSIFTYYTWLKQAHIAVAELMMYNTAAVTAYPKVQYNLSEEQGFQPISIGQPWGNKTDTPNYLNYSVYGPTFTGPRGAMMMKPSVAPMDVMDTWNLSYDPAYSVDQNIIRNLGQVGQGVLGKNINIIAQLPLELITKTSPSTGKPSQVKDAQTLMDRLFSMTGFYSIAQGLGYTPPTKGEESTNPLTQRDRDLKVVNSILGQKMSDVYVPSTLKNAQSEQSARMNAFLKNYQGDK